MRGKGQFGEVDKVIDEYFVSKHTEPVPQADLEKPPNEVFYLPIHVVCKESSTTTKVRAVFNASAKTSTGTSLNDVLLVGPIVHPPLMAFTLTILLYLQMSVVCTEPFVCLTQTRISIVLSGEIAPQIHSWILE